MNSRSIVARMMRRPLCGAVVACLLSLGAVPARAQAAPMPAQMTDIRVALAWLRNGQYAALLLADSQGYFAEEGLRVTFLNGGPGKNPVPLVAAGRAQFGVTGAPDIFTARVAPSPLDIVGIGAMGQENPGVFMTLANPADPPPTPKDMEGKIIGVQPGADFILKTVAVRNGADFDKMKLMVVGASADPLLVGQVNYFTAFLTNQVYQVEQEIAKPNAPANLKGKVVRGVRFNDFGIPLYSDVLYTTGKTIKDDPDLVRHFMRAAARGIQFMVDHPDEATKIVAVYPEQIEDEAKLAWRFKIQSELAVSKDTKTHGYLWMDPTVWISAMELYLQSGQIPRIPKVEEIMTNAFNPLIKSPQD